MCIALLFMTCSVSVHLFLQVYDKFAELVAARVSALKVGDGAAADTTHGPLISPAGVEKVGDEMVFNCSFLCSSSFCPQLTCAATGLLCKLLQQSPQT
jgi:hypothetical protein